MHSIISEFLSTEVRMMKQRLLMGLIVPQGQITFSKITFYIRKKYRKSKYDGIQDNIQTSSRVWGVKLSADKKSKK